MDKSTILLAYAKREIPKTEDDPFNDRELFDTECARYFAVAGATPSVDPNALHRHRLVVETGMFGGTGKHIDGRKFEEAKTWLDYKK